MILVLDIAFMGFHDVPREIWWVSVQHPGWATMGLRGTQGCPPQAMNTAMERGRKEQPDHG